MRKLIGATSSIDQISGMKYIVYIFCALNLYAGIRFLLNALGILQTSKYANASNVFFAVTLTTAGIVSFYISMTKGSHSLALLIDAAPWILTLCLLIVSMIFGDYK